MAANLRTALLALACVTRTVHADYLALDGSANNLINPAMSQANTIFKPCKTYYADGIETLDPTLPGPRHISNALFAAGPFRMNDFKVSAFTAAWGQFIAHDVIMTAPNSSETLSIAVPSCDGDNLNSLDPQVRPFRPAHAHPCTTQR